MSEDFDLIVLGTGSAATTVATLCREAGRSVAVADCRPFGGTCALRGCDPKKVLVGAAEVVDWARRMAGKGIDAGSLRMNWPELMRFKRTFTDPVPASRERSFAESGITALHGAAQFAGANAVRVADRTLAAKHIVIATGARPAALHIPGEELLLTSDDFLELESMPESVIFVGGGYIAFEFAHIAARAGSRVMILHRGSQPLEAFDPDLVQLLLERTRVLGVDVRLGAGVTGVQRIGQGFRVHSTAGDSKAAAVIHAAGRAPDIDALDLAAAGVERTPHGIRVNGFLQSVSNPAVYAAGDAAAGGAKLTPVAGYEARIVAENLLQGNRRIPDYRGTASVVFTIPPLASAGLTEKAAGQEKRRFTVRHGNTSGWYSSRRVAEEYSAYKLLLEEGSERILGAHLLGGGAPELINLFSLAIRTGLAAGQLKDVLYGYPTHASDVQYML